MKKLREKLHSQRGASILLALLFLLVCMMVAASVLMAAVSNAGKIRSNYDEQQRYLALSSALRLVVDELEQAKYYGWYTVEEWNETITVKDADGIDIVVSNIDYYRITQEPGAFTCDKLAVLVLNADGKPTQDSTAVLSFQKELDSLFAEEFTGAGYTPLFKKDENQTASLPADPSGAQPAASFPATRTLTVTVTGDEEISKRVGSVKVDVAMDRNRRLHLTAKLPTRTKKEADGTVKPDMENGVYVMEAELLPRLIVEKADGTVEELPAGGMPSISYPLGALPKSDIPASGSVPGLVVLQKTPRTEPTKEAVAWRLDWISRETKEGQGR